MSQPKSSFSKRRNPQNRVSWHNSYSQKDFELNEKEENSNGVCLLLPEALNFRSTAMVESACYVGNEAVCAELAERFLPGAESTLLLPQSSTKSHLNDIASLLNSGTNEVTNGSPSTSQINTPKGFLVKGRAQFSVNFPTLFPTNIIFLSFFFYIWYFFLFIFFINICIYFFFYMHFDGKFIYNKCCLTSVFHHNFF